MVLFQLISRMALALSLVILQIGCSGVLAPAEKLSVDVSITQSGKPLSNAEVMLVPVGGSGKDFLMGQAGQDGKATVMDVPPGEYEVRITRMAAGGPDPAFAKFGEGSTLRANVTPTNTSFTFDLDAG